MKKCVLYDGKVCNDCVNAIAADLDPGKFRLRKRPPKRRDEFNSIIYRYRRKTRMSERVNASDECECEANVHHENGENCSRF